MDDESSPQEGSSYPSTQDSGSVFCITTGRDYECKNIRGTVNVLTEELVAVLDKCKISYRNSSRIIHAVAEALGFDTPHAPPPARRSVSRMDIRVSCQEMSKVDSGG